MSLALSVVGPGDIDVVDIALPPPGKDEVRIAIHRCGICGSDLHWYTGHRSAPTVCPGHEISAEVEAVGADALSWREGDRVVVEPLVRCGSCERCRAGQYNLCRSMGVHGVTHPGGMAEQMLVRAETLHRLPDSVDFDLGALAEPVAVGVHALRVAGMRRGDSVAVLGSGTIGLTTIVAARHLGAGFIGATGRHAHQRSLAMAVGADQAVCPEELRTLEQRPSIVIETVGGGATTVADGVRAVDFGGTVVMVGLFDGPPHFDPMQMLRKEVRLVGSNVYNHPTGERSDFAIALEILERSSDQLRRLISGTVALRDAGRGFAAASDKSTGSVKVLLDPTA